jgi:hypothetical protein
VSPRRSGDSVWIASSNSSISDCVAAALMRQASPSTSRQVPGVAAISGEARHVSGVVEENSTYKRVNKTINLVCGERGSLHVV